MELDFREIIALVNRTGVLSIRPEPVEMQGGQWCLFESGVRVGLVNVTLYLLNLLPGLSRRDELARAIKALRMRLGAGGAGTGQIVYADSLVENDRFPSLADKHRPDGIARQSVREFFVSLAEQQLSVYLSSLRHLDLRNYIDPELVMLRGDTRSDVGITHLIRGSEAKGRATPELNVLVAEPGQGKTYFCSYLAQRVAQVGRIPFLVSSNQWARMSPADLQSPWITIVNALEHFGAPIPWADGAEEDFVRVAQKSGAFTLIFDGFDEYVLRRTGSVGAPDVLEAFRELAISTGSQILITARTAFWESGGAEVFATFRNQELRAESFVINPFDRQHAHRYFDRRLEGRPHAIQGALELFDRLGERRGGGRINLVGRGFLLSLIADLADRRNGAAEDTTDENSTIRRPLEWVCESFCERENLRQDLGVPARVQIAVFEELSEAIVTESGASTETLALLLQTVAGLDDEHTTLLTGVDGKRAGKLAYHPLLQQRPDRRWVFCQDQLHYLFAARRVLALLDDNGRNKLANFLGRIRELKHLHFEIAGFLLYILSPTTRGSEALRRVVTTLIDIESSATQGPGHRSSIAACLAILAVNDVRPRGADKLERREFLQEIVGSGTLAYLHFSDTLTNFDFRGVTFRDCSFENLTFIRCQIDETTRFVACRFSGIASHKSEYLGRATYTSDCTMDPEFRRLIALEIAGSDPRPYSADDLRADLELALMLLLPNDTLPPAAISLMQLQRGRIGLSPLKEQIVDALCQHLLEKVPGSVDSAPHLRLSANALPAVHFHRTNGVFTGPLASVWSTLTARL